MNNIPRHHRPDAHDAAHRSGRGRWIAADAEYDRRKNNPQRIADEIMRRDRDAVARSDREMFGTRFAE